MDEIIFTGQLAPGETLVIDAREKTATKNEGTNAIHQVEGLHAFDLQPGTNLVEYQDDESSRQLLFQIRLKGRWV